MCTVRLTKAYNNKQLYCCVTVTIVTLTPISSIPLINHLNHFSLNFCCFSWLISKISFLFPLKTYTHRRVKVYMFSFTLKQKVSLSARTSIINFYFGFTLLFCLVLNTVFFINRVNMSICSVENENQVENLSLSTDTYVLIYKICMYKTKTLYLNPMLPNKTVFFFQWSNEFHVLWNNNNSSISLFYCKILGYNVLCCTVCI